MWYAPIGSVEYVRNLHNDKKIKEYLLNENRLKNNTLVKFTIRRDDINDPRKITVNKSGITFGKISSGRRLGKTSRKDNQSNRMSVGKPITMKTQSAVLIQILRSYRKTALDVISYAKNLKPSNVSKKPA